MTPPPVAAEAAPAEPTTVEKIRGLRWSLAANVSNTVFVQFTFFGSIFVLFLDALGLEKGQIGFLLSLLPFAGLISILVAQWVQAFGYKRAYLTFWIARSMISAFLLLIPWVLNTHGPDVTLLFIAVTVAAFALMRSVGMTASMPWAHEYVPASMRGKYTASNNVLTSLAGFLSITVGGFVLGRMAGLSGFMLLIGVGVVAGFVSVWFASFIPGGAPRPRQRGVKQSRDLRAAVQDPNFLRYLIGVAVLTLATVPLNSFVPLFMREEVGLSAGNVVLLQIGTLGGSLVSSYAWGWAADRYGSKPIMLWGLGLRVILPLLWMAMPRNVPASLYIALAIALFRGIADMGWGIGSARLLYVGVVPTEKRSDYMALYNAWTGIAGGLSQLAGGWILGASQGISGQVFYLIFDPYLPLFLLGITLPLVSMAVMNAIRSDETVGMGEFAGIFFRGNPFLAMTSMIRFHLAGSEEATVRMTERLGEAKSPLAVDELLEALSDPRFNVRFEAVVSIARMPPDPRLTGALVDMLNGTELALSAVSAWALGRSGNEQAWEALRTGLDSEYRSIQAHSARALGALGRTEVAPLLLERLQAESDKGLRMAYASALGNLQAVDATAAILDLLDEMENEGARLELALSLARLVGDERHFVQLARSVRSDPGTTLAQQVIGLRRRIMTDAVDAAQLNPAIERCADRFAHNDLDAGVRELAALLHTLPLADLTAAHGHLILARCAERMSTHGALHLDYVLLALHTLWAAM